MKRPNIWHRIGGTGHRRDPIFAALVLLGIGVLLLLPAMRPGTILAPVDLWYETPVYAAERSTGYEEPANPHLFDQAYQFVPWRHHAWQRMRDGELPLWNALSAAGTPLVATLQAAVFYPVNLLTLPIPFAFTFVVSALLRLWIAGFTTYLLMRRYGTSMIAALVAGTSFMLSGFIVSWLGHPHTNVAIWLPALILSIEGLVTSTAIRSRMRWGAALAAVTGIQFLGGHIETSRDILFAAGVYAIVRLIQQADMAWRTRGLRLTTAGLAVAVGAGMSAIQLLPFLEWLPLSAEYQDRGAAGFQAWDFDYQPLLALPLAAMPNLYGNPTWEGAYWSFNPWGSFNESVLYAGTIPIALAISALVTWRSDSFVRCWSIVGGLTLGMALQLPIFDWVNQLPGFALAHSGRLRLVTIFAVALLAGRGLDALLNRRTAESARKLLAIALGLVSVFVGGILVLFNVVFPRMSNWDTRAVGRMLDHFAGSARPPRTVLVCQERLAGCAGELERAFTVTNWEMYLPLPAALAGLAVVWIVSRSRRKAGWIGAIFLVLAAAELLAIGWGYNPAVDSALLDTDPAPLAIAADVAGDGRLTVLQQDSMPDSHMIYGIEDIRGLDFKTHWYETYLDASGNRIPWLRHGVLLDDAGPLIKALDVRAVLTANPHLVDRLTADGSMRVAETSGDFTVVAPVRPAQRAALYHEIRLVDSDEEAARLLAEEPELIFTQALLPDSNANRRLRDRIVTPSEESTAATTSSRPEFLTIDVETATTGLLVIADAYYPGWTATVDGEPAEILRANIALRGIVVGPGSHVVELRYEPASVRYGMLVSLLSTVAVVGIFALSFKWRQ